MRLNGTPFWKQSLAFLFGFSIQCNVLIGGGGEGVAATGGYGYRLTDFVAVGALGLLGISSLISRRILPISLFGMIVAALFILPMLSSDPRTVIVAQHYALYSFAALYVAIILSDVTAIEQFCWGLIVGLMATVPIFVAQDLGYTSALMDLGLLPGYSRIFEGIVRDVPRYSGLSGHPNEAGHVAALSAAAGAYFAFARGRFLPLAFVAASLVVIFYYTWSRGGLLVGGIILAIPFLFARRGAAAWRSVVMAGLLAIILLIASETDFVASRFSEDPNAANNITDRIESTLYSLELMFTHPLGMSATDLALVINSGTGGVGSAHNGFFFFGGIFGLLPLIILLAAFIANLRVRDDVDVFFAFLTLQVTLSFLFEQLSGAYSYAFVMCIIVARAFVKTRLGADLTAPLLKHVSRLGRAAASPLDSSLANRAARTESKLR